MIALAIALLAAYALGALPTGYYLVRLRTGGDIRALGSGSAGARNVGRLLGRRWAVAVAAVDIGRGAVAVAIARWLAPETVAWAMPVAIAGHIWPVQLALRGGKGMAVGFGALLGLDLVLAALAVLLNAALSATTRSVTAGTLLATAAVPPTAMLLVRPAPETLALAAGCGLVLWAHRDRLQLSLAGLRPR